MDDKANKQKSNKSINAGLSVNKLIDELGKNGGNIAAAAKALKCERAHIYRMIARHPDLKDLINIIREDILDEAEISLLERIQEGNITSIIFALKTLGKSRGYSVAGDNKKNKMDYINEAALRTLTDEQLAHLEKLIKSGKDPGDFLVNAGVNVTPD